MLWFTGEIIVGFVLLTWGADRFVGGAAAVARKLGLAPLLVGLTILAVGTSAPEIFVSAFSAYRGAPDLAVSNAIGSNIVNIGLVLGLVALIRPILLTSATVRREMATLLAVSLLVVTLLFDGFLGRVDGVMLFCGLVLISFRMIRIGTRSSDDDPLATEFAAEIPEFRNMRIALFWLVAGLATLLAGSELLVDGAIKTARFLGVSEVVIGITMVAFGTSLPELAVSIISVLRREYGMVLGNIIGSNIVNSLAVIGVTAVIAPSPLPPSISSLHIPVMAAFTLGLFALTSDWGGKQAIGRGVGLALLVVFLAYAAYTVTTGAA